MPAYRGEVADLLSRALGLPVEIASLTADWGLHPTFRISGLDHQGCRRPAGPDPRPRRGRAGLDVAAADAAAPGRLEIDSPIWRSAATPTGRSSSPVAGENRWRKGDFAQWLFDQRRIQIHNARLELARRPCAGPTNWCSTSWSSASTTAAATTGSASPPSRPAAWRPLDVRGDLRGGDPAKPAEWRGELSPGSITPTGGVAPVGGLPAGGPTVPAGCGCGSSSPTARHRRDHRLRPARRPRPAGEAIWSPFRWCGRLGGCATDEGGVTEASGRQLSLETTDGLSLAPTDFFLVLRDKRRRAGQR